MKKIIITIIVSILFVNCSRQQEARKPLSVKTGSFISASIQRNKKMVANEEDSIKQYISKDTLNQYTASQKGYWFTVLKKGYGNAPQVAEKVSYQYSVLDMSGNVLYDSIAIPSYIVDKENIIMGLRDGIKKMNKGAQYRFLFPSRLAYGYLGDQNKIGKNQPLRFEVTLLKIEK